MDTSNCIKPQVREGAQPLFLKGRPVPYGQKLQRLEDEKILYKVSQSDWAAPKVLVPKKYSSLHFLPVRTRVSWTLY